MDDNETCWSGLNITGKNDVIKQYHKYIRWMDKIIHAMKRKRRI